MSEALQLFNEARRDSEWGDKALINMVEICLNPDKDILSTEAVTALNKDQR